MKKLNFIRAIFISLASMLAIIAIIIINVDPQYSNPLVIVLFFECFILWVIFIEQNKHDIFL
jgi:Ca2+/Na+ antiporter